MSKIRCCPSRTLSNTEISCGNLCWTSCFSCSSIRCRSEYSSTCYPEVAEKLKTKFRSIRFDAPVVDSEVKNSHLITSQGPATAIEFALKILSRLTDKKKSDEIRGKLLV